MTSYQWPEKSIKPDRTGVWAYRRDDGVAAVTSILDEDERQGTWPGAWVRISDLPEIADPPKWRDVNEGDVGEMVCCSDIDPECALDVTGKFIGMDNDQYVIKGLSGCYARWKFARILDQPDTAKVTRPREWWILRSIAEPKLLYAYDSEEKARGSHTNHFELFHVREAIEPAS